MIGPLRRTVSNVSRAEYHRLMVDCGYAYKPDPDPLNATGEPGQCWRNARTYVASHPGSHLVYVEGIACTKAFPYGDMHGYVLDLAVGHVIETTTGYGNATGYRGMPIRPDAWRNDPAPADDINSLIWLDLWDSIEAAGEPYRLPRRWRPSATIPYPEFHRLCASAGGALP